MSFLNQNLTIDESNHYQYTCGKTTQARNFQSLIFMNVAPVRLDLPITLKFKCERKTGKDQFETARAQDTASALHGVCVQQVEPNLVHNIDLPAFINGHMSGRSSRYPLVALYSFN